MIFSSTEANDMVSVEVLTVLTVLMTVVMMAWLFVQLFRDCGHENRTRVVELKEKIIVLKRRISGSVRRERGEANETDDGERNGTEGTTIEMENLQWSMPNNPVFSL
jgi:hypothetical protein